MSTGMRDGIVLPRELVLASAGTGKTFRISSRIIGLLAAGSRADAIFASTFTRKAAGEILERVLARLAAAALDPRQAAELAEHAALESGALDGWTSERWLELLRLVISDLHRLNIGTLDAFFIRTASSFADEAALPPGWGIADQPTGERVRAEALQSVLRRADPAELMELVRGVEAKDAARSVHQALLDRADALLALHHALDPGAAGAWDGFDAIAARLPADLAARCELLARGAESIEPPLNSGNGLPKKSWVSALNTLVLTLRAQDWDALLALTLWKNSRQEDPCFDKVPIPEEVMLLLADAAALATPALARRYSAQSHAMRRLATQLAAAVAAAQREAGAFGFDDVTRLIGGESPLCNRPDLFYRLDGRIRHILLDEFQDTSLGQWEALEPMLDALLGTVAEPGAAVVVADPKQSIYGWRGGEPLLVPHVGERYSLAADQLTKSYRSSPIVLDLVNRVFSTLDTNPTLTDDPIASSTASSWKQMFTEHGAVDRGMAGYVVVEVGPEDTTTGDDRPLLCRAAAQMVARLRQQAPGRSIGVLTRKNRTVARIMLELRELGVPASEEGGNPLTDSAAVAAVVSLLRLADHPADGVAAYHVAQTPLGEIFDLRDHRDAAAARRVARGVRSRLLEVGYGRFLDELTVELSGACDARDRRRMAQLAEMGFRYDARATLRPGDFVRVIETERVEDPTAADVRVMTVHQAKGLEFDIIVLPELDVALTKTRPAPLSYRPVAAGRATKVFPYVSRDAQPLFAEIPELGAAVEQATAALWRDGLSGLYVALTRARHAVHILVRPDGARGMGTAKSGARLVRLALDLTDPTSPGDILFESGDPEWYAPVAVAPAGAAAITAPLAPGRIVLRAGGSSGKGLPRLTPSGLAAGDVADLRSLLTLERGAAESGTLAHAWFERIGWLEDGTPSDAELREIARRATPTLDPERVELLRLRFRSWLGLPEIRYPLLRGSHPPGATVERELKFMYRSEGRLVEGIIDRLTLERRNGAIVGAGIIDYKTDTLPTGDATARAARVERYRPQLEAYRAAVTGAYSLPPGAITAHLAFLDSGLVVEL